MKVVSIVGARPEFVQAAPISRALRARHQEILVHTGQHYDYQMSAVFFEQLGLAAPDYNLEVGPGSHAWQTGQILIRLEAILLAERPDWVIVRGDTNSTLGGGLAAAKLNQRVVHVEAGLRSFDRTMPEEVNRVLVDHLSDVLFCPTDAAARHLEAEGIRSGVYRVGDVMYDGLLYNLEIAETRSQVLQQLGLEPRSYLLATVHRASNTDDCANLRAILSAFGQAQEPIVFPVHPRTRKQITAFALEIPPNVMLHPPLSYFDNLVALKNARLLLTDSGGMQKEAYCLGTPCITLREQTEWVETVEVGWNLLTGPHTEKIVTAVRTFAPPTGHPPLYGEGHAAEEIVGILEELHGES